MYFVAVRLF